MKQTGRPVASTKPSDEMLLEEYETLTAKEMGNKYGVREVTVRAWVYETRRKNEQIAGIPESFKRFMNRLSRLQSEAAILRQAADMSDGKAFQKLYTDLTGFDLKCEKVINDIKRLLKETE